MNIKLTFWASIAEISASVAVVVTLVLLVMGVNENTAVTRSAAYDQNIESMNAWRRSIVQNNEIFRVYQAYAAGDTSELTDEDQFRLFMTVAQLWNIYEKAYYANRYEVLSDNEWTRNLPNICMQYQRILRNDAASSRGWSDYRTILTDEFGDYVERLVGGDYCEG